MIGEHLCLYACKNVPHSSLTIWEHYGTIIARIVPQKEEKQWQYSIDRYRNCSEIVLLDGLSVFMVIKIREANRHIIGGIHQCNTELHFDRLTLLNILL